ncbi:MAG: OmpA family protein [Deltaproteobacteria bacterium]|nr:OmpA family protein [Deltaproteobacteria bacterium]
MRRRIHLSEVKLLSILVASAALLLSAQARAQASTTVKDPKDTSFSIQLFRPAPGPLNFIAVESPEIGDDMMPSVGFVASYQHKPFVILTCDGDSCGDSKKSINVVENLATADVLGSFNFLYRFQVGLAIPLVLAQRGHDFKVVQEGAGDTYRKWLQDDGSYGTTFAVSDIRLHLKARILGEEKKDGPVLSAAVIPTFPLQGWAKFGKGFTGDGFMTLEAPKILFGYRFSQLRAAANLGVIWRQKSEFFSAEEGHTLTYGGALGYAVIKEVEIIGEIFGQKSLVSKNFTDLDSAPLLFLGGARFRASDFVFTVAGGGGILSGVGVPQFQVVAGAAWAPQAEKKEGLEVSESDRDGDGIDNDSDECPDEPEDPDGFQDEDGCPDLDNDNDGILDGYDSCPNEPEDKDGFQDDDGCPDLDHDADGIPTPVDKCPDEAEDLDGFEDQDGCPDPDNDKDGICDPWVAEKGLSQKYASICKGSDACPNEPEDKDGFEDNDGCPDFDNDNDGVPDAKDKCPNQPETLNGFEDDDGCPDKGPVLVVVTEDKIELKEMIQFETDSDKIVGQRSFEILDIVAKVLNGNKSVRVTIEGHTDDKGNAVHNRDLSKRRADSVKRYLVDKGVAANRMETAGYGPDRPISNNKTAAGRAQNRRVEFVIIQPEKKAAAPTSGGEMDFTTDGAEKKAAPQSDEMDFTTDGADTKKEQKKEEPKGDTMDFTQ